MPENLQPKQRRRSRSFAPKRSQKLVAERQRQPQPRQNAVAGATTTLDFGTRRFASAENRPNLAAGPSSSKGQMPAPPPMASEEAEQLLQALPSLLARLDSAAYFWETPAAAQQQTHYQGNGRWADGPSMGLELLRPLDGRIPGHYGRLLNSDLPAMEEQLAGIHQSLVQLRQFRLSQPTSEYFQSAHSFKQQRQGANFSEKPVSFLRQTTEMNSPMPSLFDIRARLMNMEFHVEHRIRDLIDQRMMKTPGGAAFHSSAPATAGAVHYTQCSQHSEQQGNAAAFDKNKMPNASTQPTGSGGQATSFPQSQPVAHPSPSMPTVLAQYKEEAEERAGERGGMNEGLTAQKEGRSAAGGQQPTSKWPAAAFEPVRPLLLVSSQPQTATGDGGAPAEERRQEEAAKANKTALQQQRPAEPSPKPALSPQIPPPSTGARSQEDVNFQRMLEVLKNPRQFNLSSSSSSSDDERPSASKREATMPTAISQMRMNPAQQSPMARPQPQPTMPMPNAAATAKVPLVAPIGGGGDGGDSDSDFFR